MTKDDIIRMAREAGKTKWYGTHPDGTSDFICAEFTLEQLKRFAALVIKPWADQLEVERKRFQELNDVAALGMQHARADEREACAALCEEDGLLWGKRYAAAIRSRGQDPMPLFDDWDKDWTK